MSYEILSPWPTITRGGVLQPGTLISVHPTCLGCDHHRCIALHNTAVASLGEYTCSKGLTAYSYRDDDDSIVIAGVGNPERDDLPKSFSRYKQYLIRPAQVSAWLTRTRDALEQCGVRLNEEVKASIRGLHNILPVVNIVVRGAEEIIYRMPGRDFATKIAGATQELADLYYGAQLVPWMIDIQHNMVNPDSITYGRQSPKRIYPLIDRLVRSFRVLAKPEHKRITMRGECYRAVQAYDSISNVFVIILDNAVKYSLPNQDVFVDVDDVGDHVRVQIESYGPLVDQDERDRIFSGGFRGANARRYTAAGTGRGLYVAAMIAGKHNTRIQYVAGCQTSMHDGVPCGTNTFMVRLH